MQVTFNQKLGQVLPQNAVTAACMMLDRAEARIDDNGCLVTTQKAGQWTILVTFDPWGDAVKVEIK